MARWRYAVELAMTDEEIGRLAAIARSRSEAARWVQRAQILLNYHEKPSFFAVGQRLGIHHQTVQRCVERAMAYRPLAALDDRPRNCSIPPVLANSQILAETDRPGRSCEPMRGSFHDPICPKTVITLSRKDWHSSANGAVV